MASVAYIVLSAFGWVAFTLYLVMLVFKKVAAARAKISDETKVSTVQCSSSKLNTLIDCSLSPFLISFANLKPFYSTQSCADILITIPIPTN